MMSRVKVKEGDWFAVPLRDGGYVLGLVARANPEGVLAGYFFGSARRGLPSLSEPEPGPMDAVLVGRFGHLGLAQGKWPLLGRQAGWDRSKWPMPVFVRYEELTGRTFRVFYDDADPNLVLREEEVTPGPAEQAPKDGLMGAGFVERVLTRLVGPVLF